MAKTRYILFLITSILAYIDSTNGGYYTQQSNVQNTQSQNNEALSNIGNAVSSDENQKSDLISNQNLDEKLNNEGNGISTRYELDQTVPQNINEEQYRNAVNQLESERQKPDNYNSNQEQAPSNTIQNAYTQSSEIRQSIPESVNLLPNQQNSVNTNQILVQSESIRTTHLRSFYPTPYQNYATDGTIPAQSVVNALPLSALQPQVNGHQIQVNTQNVLPHVHVETLPDQRNNLFAYPLSPPPTFGSGQISVAANVQNVLPRANVGIIPTQSFNVRPLSLSPVQPLVEGNRIPVNYNVHHLPYANVGVIPAQPSPDLPLPLSTPPVIVNDRQIPLNSGVHILPQENVEILPQPNILQLPVTQQTLVNGHQIPNYLNVQNLPSPLNVPAGGQFILNGASGYANIGSQNSLPVNVQPAPIAPIVTKDIYFHAAPPNFEDVPAPTLPPKKTYKIIFIKLPSQERKNTALLQNLYNQYATREDKTLIYVLVKKPEEQQVIVPPQSKAPSKHEVLFVNYKNVKDSSATVETDEAEPKHDDSLLLKPGLVNGH